MASKEKVMKKILENRIQFNKLNQQFNTAIEKNLPDNQLNSMADKLDCLYNKTWNLFKSIGLKDFHNFMEEIE